MSPCRRERPFRLGVHAGYYGGTGVGDPVTEMRRLWRACEDAGFDWISVWDHFFDPSSAEPAYCLDVVAMQTALACETTRVRCGSLVHCVAYRRPIVIASAIATIDHLSAGRAELGLGAGWSRAEFIANGVPFGSFGERIEMLAETVQCIRRLLAGGAVEFEGRSIRLDGARCHPGPVQNHLPIWVGGRSAAAARVAAQHADGLNLPYVGTDVVARRRQQMNCWSRDAGREAGECRLSVNVAIALDEDDYERQFRNVGDHVRAGVAVGGSDEIAGVIRGYADAGAEQVNLTIRAPWEDRLLDTLLRVRELIASD